MCRRAFELPQELIVEFQLLEICFVNDGKKPVRRVASGTASDGVTKGRLFSRNS